MRTIRIIYNGNIYDVYENGTWKISRTSPQCVFDWLAEISKDEPIKIIFEDKKDGERSERRGR